jgi:outer membrane biogenesis lipoprotein LolB
MMKTRFFALCTLTLATLMLSGCATHTHTATTPAPENDPTLKRTYTQEQLRKTGEPETAAALEKVDPSVRTSGPR